MADESNAVDTNRLIQLANEWIRSDPDHVTRTEMRLLVECNNTDELRKRLVGRIQFGTAGLRAKMEAGTTRMNALTVMQTSQGLAAYLLKMFPDARFRGVVLGRDARRNSEAYAHAAAEAFNVSGIKVHWYSDPVHTPLVPFGVTYLGAVAGVMITASHNPKDDNGYKVYWQNGCQIIPPHDTGIAKSIMQNLVPKHLEKAVEPSLFASINDDRLFYEYFAGITRLARHLNCSTPFVYTPLHGVGFRPFKRALTTIQAIQMASSSTGEVVPLVVALEQVDPDPDFPTVKFPNPEEKGALDLAIATAEARDIPLVIANDPDADRLAVAQKIVLQPTPQEIQANTMQGSRWHQFTGNQLGVLLASRILDIVPAVAPARYAMLRSTVSTAMLDVMCAKRGYHVQETLTGFKWLGNVAKQLRGQGMHVNFAFEEALGYMFPSIVYDKDGISAAAFFVSAMSRWQTEGMTPYQKLQQLYRTHGFFAEANSYLKSPSPAVTARVFSDIRAMETPHPSKLDGAPIYRWRDLTVGYDSDTQDKKPSLPVDSSSQMITLWCREDVRITVRASGTEPKIKFYVECQRNSWDEAETTAKQALSAIIRDWFTPEKYGLVRAE